MVVVLVVSAVLLHWPAVRAPGQQRVKELLVEAGGADGKSDKLVPA
eukprot:gene464-730_t